MDANKLVRQEKILVEEQCHEQSRLGKEYAEEAREWVALASRLSEELKAAREEASIIPDLRKVPGCQLEIGISAYLASQREMV